MKVKFNQFKTKLTRNSDSKGSNIMKKNRKLTALLVAACMTIPMAATTFTVPMMASAGSITINNATTNNNNASNMKAYQVFTGTYSGTSLGVTGWNSEFQAANFINALKGDSIFGEGNDNIFNSVTADNSAKSAQDVAGILSTLSSETNKLQLEAVARYAVQYKGATASGNSSLSNTTLTINGLNDGYYVIVDSSAGTDEALTLGLLQVGSKDNLTVDTKRVVPTVTKTAKDSKTNDIYDDVIDCYIGETVHFKVEVNVPDLSNYTDYYLEIVDTLGTDFDMPASVNLSRTNSNGNGNEGFTADSQNSSLEIDAANNKIIVKFENAIEYSKKKIYLEYDAVLNKKATTGESAFSETDKTQTNEVFVKYLKDPNNTWKADSANNSVDTVDDTLLSSTTPAVVKVLTYQLEVLKYRTGEEDVKLKDAEFKLKDSNDNNAKYVKKVDENDGKYEIEWTNDKEQASTFTTAEGTGLLTIYGLDAGTYWLEETKAPDGYNILTDPVKVEIIPIIDTVGDPLTALAGKVNDSESGVTGDTELGKVQIKIANSQGATLPSTGGIGTKIFYVLGGTLVIGSGAALVIKKRMGKDEE